MYYATPYVYLNSILRHRNDISRIHQKLNTVLYYYFIRKTIKLSFSVNIEYKHTYFTDEILLKKHYASVALVLNT